MGRKTTRKTRKTRKARTRRTRTWTARKTRKVPVSWRRTTRKTRKTRTRRTRQTRTTRRSKPRLSKKKQKSKFYGIVACAHVCAPHTLLFFLFGLQAGDFLSQAPHMLQARTGRHEQRPT